MKIYSALFLVFLFTVSSSAQNAYSLEQLSKDPEKYTGLVLNEFVFSIQDEPELLKNIETLDLSYSGIEKLPDVIKNLPALKKLNISGNHLLDINQTVEVLKNTKVEVLNISDCGLVFLPFQLKYLKHLTVLIGDKNSIAELPIELTHCTQLQNLSLAYNHLDSIQVGLQNLPNLKKLDLSHNRGLKMSHLINDANDFPALENIVLNGVKEFPNTLGLRSKALNEIDFSSTEFKDINQLDKKGLKVKSVIMENCDQLDYDFACNTLGAEEVNKLRLADETIDKLPYGVQKMKSLEELSLKAPKIPYLPSLNNHKELKRLSVESDELTTIFRSINLLDSLAYLDISKTNIGYDEVDRLLQHFPHTEVVYNPRKQGRAIEFPKHLFRSDINAPFKELLKSAFIFKFSGKEKAEIVLPSGTVFDAPANGFVNNKGAVYKGEIEFEISEYKNGLDIYFSGIPMLYDSANTLYGFESGGMYNMVARDSIGNNLELKDGASVGLTTNLPDNLGGFGTYVFRDGVWVLQSSPVTDGFVAPRAFSQFQMGTVGLNADKPISPHLLYEDLALVFTQGDEVKGFEMKIYKGWTGERQQGAAGFNRAESGKVTLKPFRALQRYKWIVVEYDFNSKLKNWKKHQDAQRKARLKLNKTVLTFPKIDSVYIEPLIEEDCFELVVKTWSDEFRVKIIPDMQNVGPRSSKRRLTNMWKSYERGLSRVEKHNNQVRTMYERDMSVYQNQLVSWFVDSTELALKKSDPEAYKKLMATRRKTVQYESGVLAGLANSKQFRFNALGPCNIDRIMTDLLANYQSVKMIPVTMSGASINLEHFSVVSSRYASAMQYTGDTFSFSNRSSNLIIGKTRDGMMAYVTKNDFEGLEFSEGLNEIRFNIIDPSKTSPEALSKILLN